MTGRNIVQWIFISAVFACGLLVVPLRLLEGLEFIPGDVGDARLNNYFLENIFLYFTGRSESLWHLPFFAPFPYIIGFSDNHFGTAPIYMVFRAFGADQATSFQLWFLGGYVANFFAGYAALRVLRVSCIGATFGALIFAFALPTTAHAGHAQLHYRFGLALSFAFFVRFLEDRQPTTLLASAMWITWQFFAGIYMGFFTLLMIAASIGAFWFQQRKPRLKRLAEYASEVLVKWRSMNSERRIAILLVSLMLAAALLLLFYPYVRVSLLYGARRSWGEISVMLPRIQSYISSDWHWWWRHVSGPLMQNVPMRHEHQMFMGLVPLSLAGLGGYLAVRQKSAGQAILLILTLIIVFVLTLNIGGASLWIAFHIFPLASAIRAMARLDQAILIIVAFYAAFAVDHMRTRRVHGWLLYVTVLGAFLIEATTTDMPRSQKIEWQNRLAAIDAIRPDIPDADEIWFFAQGDEHPAIHALDAMLVSQKHGVATMNGYSGHWPPGASFRFGNDCQEVFNRLGGYLALIGQSDVDAEYLRFSKRVRLIGFENCSDDWREKRP